ncbi:DUF3575 domain-containing protein [Parabacteroides sp. PFB2-10]|uniref:DUF3575 domain-containing protein n=1 Tax=Parabacteroides sp. PFB2-10 TaxID=1742405 RepID=UPI00247375CD|nr:DUF3575 domain-containing protein [Parabacteroides sp. PFB2-10]
MFKKRKRQLFLFLFTAIVLFHFPSQEASAQTIGVKTNAVGWGARTINAGAEWGFAEKWTADLSAFYNPFSYSRGRTTHLLGVQPEVRYWPCGAWHGHFVGLHGQYASYDWGLKKYRYKGNLYGGGLSYGYAWVIADRWNLEATIGFGATRLAHEYRYERRDTNVYLSPNPRTAWGLTRIGINFIYIIK